jgi:urease accessory protein
MSREYDSFNVSTPTLLPQRCNAVAQNASLAQGAAIIALFSRLLDTPHDTAFLAELKRRARTREIPLHNTLCFAVVCHLVKVKREKAAHLLLFNHARSVVSAAIRLNLLGPYEAQSVLLDLHGKVSELSEREVDVDGDVEYYQTNPIQDIVTGKHNQQYSRLFNS